MSLDIINKLPGSEQYTSWEYTPDAAPPNNLNVQCIFIMARCEDLYIHDDPLLGLVWKNRGERSTWCVNMSVHRGLYLKAIEHMFGSRNRVKRATRIHCIVRPEFEFLGNVSVSSVDGKEQKSNVPAPLYCVLLRFSHMKICEVWSVQLTERKECSKLYEAIKETDDDERKSNTSSQYRKQPYACPLCFACVSISSNKLQHFQSESHRRYWDGVDPGLKLDKDEVLLYHFQYCIHCDEYIRDLPTGLLLPVTKDAVTYDTTGMTDATFENFKQNVKAHIATAKHEKNVKRRNKGRKSTSIQLEPLNKFNHGKRLVRLIGDRRPESFKKYMKQTLQEAHMIDIVLHAKIRSNDYKDPKFVEKFIDFNIPSRYYEFFEKKGDYSNTYEQYKPGLYRSDRTRYHAELLDRRSKREEWLNLAQRAYWFPCNQDKDDAYGFALYLSIHNKNNRALLEANRMSTRYYSNYTKESELYKKFARFRNHYMLSSKKTYRAYMAAMLFAFRVIYDKGKDAGHTSQFSAKRKEMTKRIKIYGDFEEYIHGEESEKMGALFLLDKGLVEEYIYPNYSSIFKLQDSIATLDNEIKTSKQAVETFQQEVEMSNVFEMSNVSELINTLRGSDHESDPELVSTLAGRIKGELQQSLRPVSGIDDQIPTKIGRLSSRIWGVIHECGAIVKNIKQRYSYKRELKKNKIRKHVNKLIEMKVADFLVIFDATMGWTRFTPNLSKLNQPGQVIDVIEQCAQLIQNYLDDLDSKYKVPDTSYLDQIIKEIKDVKNSNALNDVTRINLFGDRQKDAHTFLTNLGNRICDWSEKINKWSEGIGGMKIQTKISNHVKYLQDLKCSVDELLVAPTNYRRFNDLVKEKIDEIMDGWDKSTQHLKESIKVFKQEDKKRFHMIIIQFARYFKGKSSNAKKAV